MSVLQEDITIPNVCPTTECQICEVKSDITARGNIYSTIIVGDFNTPISEIDRPSRQKISNDLVELNNIINQPNIMVFYRLFHTTTEYTF